MDKRLQTDILSENTIKKAMPSCLAYAFVQAMAFSIDTIISGHFLGEDAVAAVAMAMPMIGIMLSLTTMILQGGFAKMIELLGKNNKGGYNRIFSITLTVSIVLDIIFIGICIFAAGGVIGILGGAKATARAVMYSKLYLKTACLMIIFFAIGNAFQLVIMSFGYQAECMIGSICNVAVNILVSIAAITFMSEDTKIAGLGMGSAAGAFAQMAVGYILIKRKNIKISFRLYAPDKDFALDFLDCMHKGLPSSVDNILDSASGSVVNNIILSLFANGTSVLALVAMIKTVNTLVRTVGSGTLYASEPLIRILNGERDNTGICRTFKASLKYGCIYAAVTAALIIFLRNDILGFYGVTGVEGASAGLILIACSAVLTILMYVLNSTYESIDRLPLTLTVAVIPDSILYPLFVILLGKTLGVNGIWLAMGYSFIPFFIIYYLVFMIINKKLKVPLEKLLVLKEYKEHETAIDVSIPVDSQSVSFVSESLQSFFLKHDTSPRIAYISALCMEEIAADYLAYRKKSGVFTENAYMDIKAFRDPDKIEIILRNYDEPYDPLIIDDENGDDKFSKIGVVIVQKMASEILYGYAYHLNVVSISIPTTEMKKEETEQKIRKMRSNKASDVKIGIELNIFNSGYCRYGDQKYIKLKGHGFSCVDFNMANTNTELYTSPESDTLLLHEKSLADAAGIKIHQVHGPWRSPPRDTTPEDRAERMDKMKKSIRAAALLGCKNWVVHPLMPFGTDDTVTGNENGTWDINLRFMRELLITAKECGVTICLENMPMTKFSMAKPSAILRFVEEINDDNFKICLDAGHVAMFEGLSLSDEVRRLGNKIQVLHVHDNKCGKDLHMMPYFGTADWKAFARSLKDIGFDGVFSLETSPPQSLPDPLFEKACTLLYDIADEIINSGENS